MEEVETAICAMGAVDAGSMFSRVHEAVDEILGRHVSSIPRDITMVGETVNHGTRASH